jgi:alkylation response protein AidB-like acyl-CoA dehydrogenase
MATINALGDEEQRARLLPDCISLKKISAFALTEPLNGSDASGLGTIATRADCTPSAC